MFNKQSVFEWRNMCGESIDIASGVHLSSEYLRFELRQLVSNGLQRELVRGIDDDFLLSERFVDRSLGVTTVVDVRTSTDKRIAPARTITVVADVNCVTTDTTTSISITIHEIRTENRRKIESRIGRND